MYSFNKTLITVLLLFVTVFSTTMVSPAGAQMLPNFNNPFPSLVPRPGFLQSFLQGEMPGLADPKSTLVYPPIFRGEVIVRPVAVINWGYLEEATSGRRLDFQDDLEIFETPVIIEWMVRAQISRISLRLQFETYLSDFRGTNARLDWPTFRYGFDLDIVDTPTLRFGANLDAYREGIKFGFTGTPVGSALLETSRPVTAGLHLGYNPIQCGTIAPSFAARGRMSVQNNPRVDEAEVSLGLRSPELVLGSVALRGGWRYSRIEFTDQGFDVHSVWSSVFGELVYFF